MRKNVVFDVQKNLCNLPELEGGGCNLGNARKKSILLMGGVPLVAQPDDLWMSMSIIFPNPSDIEI